ncbi:CGNR zinc finger domain-containing protein [Anaerovirgula multivorans]|uniref:CGNR zinc finger domain-containing protein n=1 Tax=Anaerovirgula multivorans TaxID=312168 RepID=A0A239I1E6_9FIRM|nr:CGNR zinc finger domain-containing protein [Anaerovirgula multivorans]SNS87397.1 CGNR zinc finger domain-containing protein [Anaerovirgula multivorans]
MEYRSALITTREGFTFSNSKVDVKLNRGYDELGNPYNTIRLKEVDGFINFHYKDRLLRSDDSLSENDILTKLLSTGTKDEQALINFFHEYGFLFKSNSDKYALYSCDELFGVIRRITQLVELIMEIHNDEPSFKSLANNLIQLMLSYPASVHDLSSEGNLKLVYQSPEHQIRKNLISIGALSTSPDFLLEMQEKPDPDYQYFVDEDYSFQGNYQYYDSIDEGMQAQHAFLDYIFTKTSISSVKANAGVKLTKPLNIRPNKEDENVIINAAKLIIKEEIDYHTKLISPVYDTTTMLGTWKIPNLITAIYFSIFFLNPNFEVIKKCANPTCDGYFDILNTNKRKKYCSIRCANIMSQRKYRETHQK